MPKSTVKLQQTAPISKGAPTTALRPTTISPGVGSGSDEDEDDESDDGMLLPFSIIVLVLSVVVLVIEVLTKMASGS